MEVPYLVAGINVSACSFVSCLLGFKNGFVINHLVIWATYGYIHSVVDTKRDAYCIVSKTNLKEVEVEVEV